MPSTFARSAVWWKRHRLEDVLATRSPQNLTEEEAMQTAVDLRIAKELRRVLWVTGSGVRTVGISERAKRSPSRSLLGLEAMGIVRL